MEVPYTNHSSTGVSQWVTRPRRPRCQNKIVSNFGIGFHDCLKALCNYSNGIVESVLIIRLISTVVSHKEPVMDNVGRCVPPGESPQYPTRIGGSTRLCVHGTRSNGLTVCPDQHKGIVFVREKQKVVILDPSDIESTSKFTLLSLAV